jgi:hypothetical protein
LLEQDDDLVRGIYLWRMMKYVNTLTEKQDLDTIMSSPTLFHYMNVLDLGEEEALEMIAAVTHEGAETEQ